MEGMRDGQCVGTPARVLPAVQLVRTTMRLAACCVPRLKRLQAACCWGRAAGTLMHMLPAALTVEMPWSSRCCCRLLRSSSSATKKSNGRGGSAQHT